MCFYPANPGQAQAINLKSGCRDNAIALFMPVGAIQAQLNTRINVTNNLRPIGLILPITESQARTPKSGYELQKVYEFY